MSEPRPTPAEDRVLALLSEAVEPTAATGGTGPAAFVRRLIDRATLAARHRQYHIDVALLQALQDLEHRRARDASELHAVMRRLDEVIVPSLADVERRAAVAASLATEVSERVSGALAAGLEDLDVVTKQLARELADIHAETVRARFLFDEATSRPYVSDPAALSIVDDEGNERLGFRDGPGASPVYPGFEALFRGPVELVRERQLPYVDLLREHGPVLDIGCGRGELLELLMRAGVEAHGVDADPGMVEACHVRGLDVELGDGIELLEKHADGSLGAVFTAQVVEHLGADEILRLLRVALDKLRPGGVLVAETVNPHSPRALKAFWVDPTHAHPVFPEALLALARLTGYRSGEVRFPLGSGDLADDLRTQGEYALVAVAPD